MTRIRRLLIALAVAGTAAGCADRPTAPPPNPPPVPPPPPPPPAPPPGSAIVSLTTPNGDDGAVVVTLRGPGISTLETASSGYLFYSRLASDTVARVIVLGNVTAGPIFTFKVANGAELSAYRVAIDQIASRADAMRSSLGGYALNITAAP
jgi:hypothetical protein